MIEPLTDQLIVATAIAIHATEERVALGLASRIRDLPHPRPAAPVYAAVGTDIERIVNPEARIK